MQGPGHRMRIAAAGRRHRTRRKLATRDYELVGPPTGDRARELWIQHAAGFIPMEDVRRQALRGLPKGLSSAKLAIAEKAIDSSLYCLMAVIEGVTGALRNETECVNLRLVVVHERMRPIGEEDEEIASLDLAAGEGPWMGMVGSRGTSARVRLR